MADKLRIVHCLNQFFGGIGGEEEAGIAPRWFEGSKGPGNLLERLGQNVEIVGTLVVGDNYMAENPEDAAKTVVDLIEKEIGNDSIDLLVAGPAFNAGRYGMAACAICQRATKQLGLDCVTALDPENPAVEIYRQTVTIVRAAPDVMGMEAALAEMLAVGRKLVAGEALDPATDGTIARGLRQNFFAAKSGAERAIEMLMRKLEGADYTSEYPMPVFDRVSPAPPVTDMSNATLALITSGGIVPKGNPDRIEAANASRYGSYSVDSLEQLSPDTHQSVHGGYDNTYANEDPNRVLPLDAVRQLVREGRIGRLHETYFATVGNATSVKRAEAYGKDIAAKLVNVGAQAVILTST